jgi:dGTPase
VAQEPEQPGPGPAAPPGRIPPSPLARREEAATRRFPTEDRGRRLQYRGAFERDRDRIVHSRAFRRLSGKTQLLPGLETIQVRNRMTHTIEVATAARVLARHLGLNEDLAEVVALAHDLGQPPFGVAGSRALDRFLTAGLGRSAPKGAAIAGPEGFHPRAQSLVVVELIEVRYGHPGLNLTDDARDGILKLRGDGAAVPEGIDRAGLAPGEPASLEAQAVRAAIDAVTPLHDLEDALSEGLLELVPVLRLPAVRPLVERLEKAGGWPRGRFRERAALHRALVHAVLTDILVASRRRLAAAESAGPGATRLVPGRPVVAPGARGAALTDAVRELVASRVVGAPAVRRADARGEQVVLALLSSYYRDPRLLDDAVLLRYKEVAGRPYLRDLPPARQDAEIADHYHGRPAFARVLADHVAGMTDRFAQDAHGALVPGRSSR